MVDIGEIVIDIDSLVDNQDTLFAPADQIWKIMMQGVTLGKTNAAIQLFRTSVESQGDLNKRGSGYGGNVAGAYIGTSGQAAAEVTRNIPLWIDDTVGLRLETTVSMGGAMCNVTYMRVQ
jgi:hypothetical protein